MSGIVGSVMERIFGNVPAVQKPQPGTVPTGVAQPGAALPGTQQNQQVDPNGVVPKQEDKVKSPLDGLEKVWETPQTQEPSPSMFANLDPKKVLESAKQNDFAKNAITPEILAAAQKGGQEGVAALVQAMNSMGQQVYAQGAIATTQIVEAALKRQSEEFAKMLPGMVRNSTSKEAMIKANPLMGNPAVAPIAEALQQSFLKKNPNATSDEISMQVADVFSKLGEAFGPKPVKSEAEKKAAEELDWNALLSGR